MPDGRFFTFALLGIYASEDIGIGIAIGIAIVMAPWTFYRIIWIPQRRFLKKGRPTSNIEHSTSNMEFFLIY